ncbi:MAG TPA: hypothetical protein VN031_01860 [Candidatus Microsaccharimonas sp.]|nr:hypothetical protein [Candidatus Microsaccharimonas sp.]
MKHFKKLNAKGFAHWVIPALAIVVIGGIGSYVYLRQSHADPIAHAIVTNTGSGARAPITVPLGSYKFTGSDVNVIQAVSVPPNIKYYAWFHGHVDASYSGASIYRESGYYQYTQSNLDPTKKFVVTPTNNSHITTGFPLTASNTTVNLCNKYVEVKVSGHTGYYGVKYCTLNNTYTSFGGSVNDPIFPDSILSN